MITIVDYGVGNLGSIQNMLKKVGAKSVISSNANEIEMAEKLILPGVGAFDAGMKNLTEYGLIPPLNNAVIKRKAPILGICLGMQLMTKGSEEGQLSGLGWIDAHTVRFSADIGETLRVPHMGWNTVQQAKVSPLTCNLPNEPRFYFVHSYYVRCQNQGDVLLRTQYGTTIFDAALEHNNIFGYQFHPEKSHKFGIALFRAFAGL